MARTNKIIGVYIGAGGRENVVRVSEESDGIE